ncbi:hypothetical protein JNB88_12705 [Rhizobium cauense]|uniref:hypothetical protein n=1 Tax=Rhizobium cauense TaxID=1166683 RepID=UPI00056B8433|nr:hypothetical protein [Rhizobium cauense]MBW9114505.1 hypothetical protein [Rhizobium cauense]
MYGRWWAYHVAAQSRQASQSPSSWNAEQHKVAFDRADDLWIFLRLALVLAAFLAGLAGILWLAN